MLSEKMLLIVAYGVRNVSSMVLCLQRNRTRGAILKAPEFANSIPSILETKVFQSC